MKSDAADVLKSLADEVTELAERVARARKALDQGDIEATLKALRSADGIAVCLTLSLGAAHGAVRKHEL